MRHFLALGFNGKTILGPREDKSWTTLLYFIIHLKSLFFLFLSSHVMDKMLSAKPVLITDPY